MHAAAPLIPSRQIAPPCSVSAWSGLCQVADPQHAPRGERGGFITIAGRRGRSGSNMSSRRSGLYTCSKSECADPYRISDPPHAHRIEEDGFQYYLFQRDRLVTTQQYMHMVMSLLVHISRGVSYLAGKHQHCISIIWR
jgi:hypothetical protein